MNICVLTHTFPKNNTDVTAAFMKEFCDGLVSAGDNVTVLTPFVSDFDRKGNLFKVVTYKYIWPDAWHRLGYSRSMKADISLKWFNFILLPFMIFFGSISLLKVIKREKIDIVNVHWILPNGLIAFFASIVTGTPFVVTLPGSDSYLANSNKMFGWVARLVARNSSGITSNSSRNLRRVTVLGVENIPTQIIPYPVDISKFNPDNKGVDSLRRKVGIGGGDLVILAIGRMVYKKGFSYLVRAMEDIVLKNRSVKLVLGGDGDLKDELENLSQDLGLKNKVIFLGDIPRNEISTYYNLADVFVSPSIVDKSGNVDGGPVVSYESMACGKPQVVTDVLEVSNIIKNGKNGYVVRQKDSKELSLAIGKLLISEKVRREMGRANRKIILASLSIKKVGEKYSRFFKSILNR